MSYLKVLDTAPGFAPKEGAAAPDRHISGNPVFSTWLQDESRDGAIRTGIWQATPGEYRSVKGESFEFCTILEGVVELTEEGGEPRLFRAGDSFMMKPGFKGVWKTIETVRKIFVVMN